MPSVTVRGGQTIKVSGVSGALQGSGFNTAYATGTWSGGTLSFKVRPTGDSVSHSISETLTADGFINFQAKYFELFASLSGATTQSLTVQVL